MKAVKKHKYFLFSLLFLCLVSIIIFIVLTVEENKESIKVFTYTFEVNKRALSMLLISTKKRMREVFLYSYIVKNDKGEIVANNVFVSKPFVGCIDGEYDYSCVMGYLNKGKYSLELCLSEELLSDIRKTQKEIKLALPHIVDPVIYGYGIEIYCKRRKPETSK